MQPLEINTGAQYLHSPTMKEPSKSLNSTLPGSHPVLSESVMQSSHRNDDNISQLRSSDRVNLKNLSLYTDFKDSKSTNNSKTKKSSSNMILNQNNKYPSKNNRHTGIESDFEKTASCVDFELPISNPSSRTGSVSNDLGSCTPPSVNENATLSNMQTQFHTNISQRSKVSSPVSVSSPDSVDSSSLAAAILQEKLNHQHSQQFQHQHHQQQQLKLQQLHLQQQQQIFANHLQQQVRLHQQQQQQQQLKHSGIRKPFLPDQLVQLSGIPGAGLPLPHLINSGAVNLSQAANPYFLGTPTHMLPTNGGMNNRFPTVGMLNTVPARPNLQHPFNMNASKFLSHTLLNSAKVAIYHANI